MKTIVFAILGLLLVTSCNEKPKEQEDLVLAVDEEVNMEERGEYLVNILGCADCHTPKKMTDQGPVPDMERHLMGYDSSRPLSPIPENVPLGPWVLLGGELTVAVGPWGTSYAGNLTPHETGIGNWTLDQFKMAMRQGKYKGLENSRPIMPPMPVEAYKNIKDEDVEAIFAYLKTIKPIDNVVPAYQPPSS